MYSPLRHQLFRCARRLWRASPAPARRPHSTRATGLARQESKTAAAAAAPAAAAAAPSSASTAAAAAAAAQALQGETEVLRKESAEQAASLLFSSVDVNGIATCFIDTPEAVAEMVDRLTRAVPEAEPLYVDLEGIHLGRFGSVSLFVLYAESLKEVFLVDVFQLGVAAFGVPGSGGGSLQDLLEMDRRTKVFYDVRNDSDALFAHYGIRLQGVEDVQVTDVVKARGRWPRLHLLSLDVCVDRTLGESSKKTMWAAAKAAGQLLSKPEAGGSMEVFNVRPLASEVAAYCVGDVVILAELRRFHSLGLLSEALRQKAQAATLARVAHSQEANYQPAGWCKTLSPWWEEGLEWLKLEDFKWPPPLHRGRLHPPYRYSASPRRGRHEVPISGARPLGRPGGVEDQTNMMNQQPKWVA